MNNIDDGTVLKDSRIKVMRNDSIGGYSWDSSRATINDGYGINEWSQADLNMLLNNYFYDSKIQQQCYVDQDEITEICNFDTVGLQEVAQEKIENAIWNIGSNGTNDISTLTFKNIYNYERGNLSSKVCNNEIYCNDQIIRSYLWTGKIALLYPSDYGYATSSGSSTYKSTCLNTVITEWANVPECIENNWIHQQDKIGMWLLFSLGTANAGSSVLKVHSDGYINSNNGYGNRTQQTKPTAYLKKEVFITGGEGTETNPFVISTRKE